MKIALLGEPGSGKGTQAKSLAKKYGFPHISTGDIFRKEIAGNTDLGLQVEEYVKSGRLVPDELTFKIVSQRLEFNDCTRGFFLDGFPRTVEQAETLSAKLTQEKRPLDKVLYLQMTEEEVVKRLSSRRECDKCRRIYNLISQPPQTPDVCDLDNGKLVQREDDVPETIKKRLVVFANLTEPLISYYRGEGVLETINGDRPIEEVSKDIYGILDPLKK